MKAINILILLSALFCLTSCIYPDEPPARSNYEAILMTRTQLEKSVSFQPPRALINTGKIYQRGSYIFINERYKGVHIILNADPTAPQNIGFITSPGCIDIAVKGNTMYLDNAVDLIAIDISTIQQPVVTERVKDVFPELLPPDLDRVPSEYSGNNRPNNTVIVAWEQKN